MDQTSDRDTRVALSESIVSRMLGHHQMTERVQDRTQTRDEHSAPGLKKFLTLSVWKTTTSREFRTNHNILFRTTN